MTEKTDMEDVKIKVEHLLDKMTLEEAIELYYKKRQWDELGRPTPAKLSELGMK